MFATDLTVECDGHTSAAVHSFYQLLYVRAPKKKKKSLYKIDRSTDTIFIKNFYKKNEGYLQTQVGNPDGEDKPNKKFYDPRVWIRASEDSMIARAKESFKALNSAHSYQ